MTDKEKCFVDFLMYGVTAVDDKGNHVDIEKLSALEWDRPPTPKKVHGMSNSEKKKEVLYFYPLAVSREIKLPNDKFVEIFDHKSMRRIGRGKNKAQAWNNTYNDLKGLKL